MSAGRISCYSNIEGELFTPILDLCRGHCLEEAIQAVSQLCSGQKVKEWKVSSCVVSVLECQTWDRGAPLEAGG